MIPWESWPTRLALTQPVATASASSWDAPAARSSAEPIWVKRSAGTVGMARSPCRCLAGTVARIGAKRKSGVNRTTCRRCPHFPPCSKCGLRPFGFRLWLHFAHALRTILNYRGRGQGMRGTTMTTPAPRELRADLHSIEPIPDADRDSTGPQQMWIWAGANIAPVNWALGALGIIL